MLGDTQTNPDLGFRFCCLPVLPTVGMQALNPEFMPPSHPTWDSHVGWATRMRIRSKKYLETTEEQRDTVCVLCSSFPSALVNNTTIAQQKTMFNPSRECLSCCNDNTRIQYGLRLQNLCSCDKIESAGASHVQLLRGGATALQSSNTAPAPIATPLPHIRQSCLCSSQSHSVQVCTLQQTATNCYHMDFRYA